MTTRGSSMPTVTPRCTTRTSRYASRTGCTSRFPARRSCRSLSSPGSTPQAFCAFAGKSLPTEAEWERAAKGPSGDRRYPWGDDGPTCTKAVFTSQARCEDALASVGSRSPAGDSPEGCHDLAGNVAEWVLDWYARYPGTGTGTGAGTGAADPKGPDDGTLRVVRGGSASDPPAAIRTTSRFGADPSNRSEGVGFRCVHHL